MAYAQGSVVLVDDPYKRGSRPFLVVSNASRPFHGQDYTLAVMTTSAFADAVELAPNDVVAGGLTAYPSFIKPWSLHEFEHKEIHRKVAQVSDDVIRDVADGITRFVEPNA